MAEVRKHYLPPTKRIPNSHFPLLHYPGLLAQKADCSAGKAYDLFSSNGWTVNWIFRYGQTQVSHYHSRSHECMAVLTGHATIRFGVADTTTDLADSTYGSEWEAGGIEIRAKAGDIFIIPAGVAHKTYDTRPIADFALLTPGKGQGIEAADPRQALVDLELSGFTMLGAYPNDTNWDFVAESTDPEDRAKTWAVPKPEKDPALGTAQEGLCGVWQEKERSRL